MRKLIILFAAVCGCVMAQADDEINAVKFVQNETTDWYLLASTPEVTFTNGNPVISGKTYDLADGDVETAFGTAPAEKGTLTVDDFVVSNNRVTYDGKAKSATVALKEGITGAGEITVTYQQDEIEVTPIYAGEYDIFAAVTEGEKYNAFAAAKVGVLTITNSTPTALFNTKTNENVNKFLRGGQMIIRQADKEFNILGIKIR